MADLFIALIHHPVLNRNGRIVTSAVTSLDLHDIARSSHAYGVRAFFVVHPIAEQREFAAAIISHWRAGYGRAFDHRRREALELVRIVSGLDEALADAQSISGACPIVIHTSARTSAGAGYDELRMRLGAPEAPPAMILLGTGFGLAPEVSACADIELTAIQGTSDYNHLSVRAAASIILDRLRGR